MHIAIDLPDDIVATLQATCPDMTRLVLESLALEGYRSRQLSTEQVRQLLGFETRFDVYDFLGAHEVPLYTLEDLKHDLDTLDCQMAYETHNVGAPLYSDRLHV